MVLRLTDLASELLSLIAEHFTDDEPSLRSLILVSRRLQGVAESILYRDIFISTGSQCAALLQSVEAQPERANSIRTIDLRPDRDHVPGLENLGPLLCKTKSLRDLTIESSGINSKHWRVYEGSFDAHAMLATPLFQRDVAAISPDSTLPQLRRLTLHLYDNHLRYWKIEKSFAKPLLHDSLEELTISCADIPPFAFESFADRKGTPLKRLTLTECTFSTEGIHAMLAKPRALEYLYLGEAFHQRNLARGDLFRPEYCSALFASLAQQSHSLREICFRPLQNEHRDQDGYLPEAFDGFSAFTKLEAITLEGVYPLLDTIVTAGETAPPHLKQLTIKDDESLPLLQTRLPWHNSQHPPPTFPETSRLTRICERAALLLKLQRVTVFFSSIYNAFTGGPLREVIESHNRGLAARRIDFVVMYAPMTSSVIPPYLYGEVPPKADAIFDSSWGGWVQDPWAGDEDLPP